MQVEASLDPGRLQLSFDLDKADGAVRPAATSASQEDETNTSKKRTREEPGPNKKRREKVKACFINFVHLLARIMVRGACESAMSILVSLAKPR